MCMYSFEYPNLIFYQKILANFQIVKTCMFHFKWGKNNVVTAYLKAQQIFQDIKYFNPLFKNLQKKVHKIFLHHIKYSKHHDLFTLYSQNSLMNIFVITM